MATMDIKTFVNVAAVLPASQAVLIRGPHGIGKSQLVNQISSNIVVESCPDGLPLIDRRLAQMTEGDIIGLPELVDGGHSAIRNCQIIDDNTAVFWPDFNKTITLSEGLRD